MVNLTTTSRKYRKKMATGYETKRIKQIRWHQENSAVTEMLTGMKGSVLDMPVGTGRFLELYHKLKLRPVLGIDTSDDMLVLAKLRLKPKQTLMKGDAIKLWPTEKSWDIAVCVRFLNLIDETAMYQVLKELDRVTRHCLILTIRLGTTYVAKSNTATHNQKKFVSTLHRYGWEQTRDIPIFTQGWHVLKYER
jgi:ubiquinone/menaquinone biosynthesis C-methylase UbiE